MCTTAAKFHVIVAAVITQLGNQVSAPVKNTDSRRRIVPIAGTLALRYIDNAVSIDPKI